MGSDPQYAKYPDLSLAQDIFNLANQACPRQLKQASLQKIQQSISEQKMAPLYYHLAHPTAGVLNKTGEGTVSKPGVAGRRGSISSNLLPTRPSLEEPLPWDEGLYEKLSPENEEQLAVIQKEETEAEESAGETEIQQARGKRAEFWARVGDKVCCADGSIESVVLIADSSIYRTRQSQHTKLYTKRLESWAPR